MRRHHGILIAVSLVAVVPAGLFWSTLPRHAISKQNIAMIRPGMTQKQVEALLGGPPGDYGPESVASESHGISIPLPSERDEAWIAGFTAVSVRFGEDGRVVSVQEFARLVGEETWTEKVQRWLGVR